MSPRARCLPAPSTARRAATLAALASLASLALTGAARAADTSDLEGLLDQPVVSTASKTAESSSAAPAVVTTITAEDLRRYGVRSLNEAINYLSLGMVTTNPLHAVEIGARGVLLTTDYGNHVLLLVNGHALNEPWNGTAYFERGAGVPLELIDHIEITLGPGSVLYGTQAMLGVINIVTKRAKDYSGIHLIAESELATSIRGAAGAGLEWTLFGRPGELTLQFEYYAQSGPTFTFGPQNYGLDAVTGQPKRFSPDGEATGIWGGEADKSYTTRVPSLYARLLYGDFELNVRAGTYRRSTPYINHINKPGGDFNDPASYELDRMVSLDLRHRKAFSPTFDLQSRLYGDFYDYSANLVSSAAEDCLEGQDRGCKRVLLGASQWGGLEVQGTLDWTRDGSFPTLIGIDGRLRSVGSSLDISDRVSGDVVSGLGAFEESNGTFAAYIQQKARFTSWLDINAGARADFFPGFGGKLSPRAAVVVTPWRGAALKAVYAEAFRAPSAYERLFFDPRGLIASPSLGPETVRSIEGSFEQRAGAQRVLFGVFRSFWRDMVLQSTVTAEELAAAEAAGQLVPGLSPDEVFHYKNVASIDSFGFNAAFEGSLLDQRLRYGVQLTSSLTRRDDGAGAGPTPLTVGPQLFGNARVSYDLEGRLPILGLAFQLLGPRPADRAFDGHFTPPPYVPPHTEMRATVSGPFPWLVGLSYRLSANVAFGDKGPYVIGPIQSATPEHPQAELSPVDRFRVALGLQYDLQ
jgi:outer membrane receptor for ferrienterochelin and colicins